MKKQKSWRSYWVVSIVVAMMFITVPIASLAADIEFSDVQKNHPYYDVIHDNVQ